MALNQFYHDPAQTNPFPSLEQSVGSVVHPVGIVPYGLKKSIEAVKEAVLIEDYAATLTELRRNRGRCPIHRGNNPQSFAVYPEEGRWYCYRCSLGGDVINLCEFAERHADTWTAVIALSQRFGVELPQRPPGWHAWQDEKGRRRKAIREVLAKSYQRRLFKLYGDHLEAIEDPDERWEEGRLIWDDLWNVALTAAEGRMQK